MGKHFDALVEFAKKEIEDANDTADLWVSSEGSRPLRSSLKRYLETLINEAALFEFPWNSRDIFPRSGKDLKEYHAYTHNYFHMSEEHGSFFLSPFKVTAVESLESVIILDPIEGSKYRVITCFKDKFPTGVFTSVMGGEIDVLKPKPGSFIDMKVVPTFLLTYNADYYDFKGRQVSRDDVAKEISNMAISYFEQVVYLMDPENFIIRKESTQSIKEREKARKKKKKDDRLRKTIVRPHYICLNEEETRALLSGESKEARAAHPVRGHWRRLISEFYKNKRGQRRFIKQYFTGQGKIKGKGGWIYQVMVKEAPDKIVPYDKATG